MIFHHSPGGSSEKPRPSRDHPPKIHECPTQNWFYHFMGICSLVSFFCETTPSPSGKSWKKSCASNNEWTCFFARLWWTFYKSKSETTLKSTTISMCQVRIKHRHTWCTTFQCFLTQNAGRQKWSIHYLYNTTTTTFHIWRVKFQSDKSTMEMSPTRIAIHHDGRSDLSGSKFHPTVRWILLA